MTIRPTVAALSGLLFALPFALANLIVARRIEPFFSAIRPDTHTSPLEYVLLALVLVLLPIGAFVAARPLFRSDRTQGPISYVPNLIVALVLVAGFTAISLTLGSEIYSCEIVKVPNCD